jgi:hypothetical protein
MRPFNVSLRELAELEKDWDGHGSIPPTEDAIRTAANLQVVPVGGGGLQLEIHAGGSDLEIEIQPDGRIVAVHWLLVDKQLTENGDD